MRQGWIDVHHHAYHPRLVRALRDAGVTEMAPGVPLPRWSVAESLRVMDGSGIAGAVLSVLMPGPAAADGPLIRRCNEWTAELVAEWPRRFAALATLPLPDVGGSLREIEYAFDALGMRGVVLPASLADGRLLGDPLMEPVFAELDRRRAVAFVHPAPAFRCACAGPGADTAVPPPLVDFVFDTTRSVADLMLRGVPQRRPGIEFVLAHAGGSLPYLMERLELAEAWVASSNPYAAASSVREVLARFHYEIGQSAWSGAFACLRAAASEERILFGTDYPFMGAEIVERTRSRTELHFDEDAAGMIGRGNAAALFPELVGSGAGIL